MGARHSRTSGLAFLLLVAPLLIAAARGAEPSLQTSRYVGCATVSMAPATTVFYGSPSGMPQPTMTGTYPLNPSYYAFNVGLQSYTITADADGDTVEMTIPAPLTDQWTLANLVFDHTTFPNNPQPAGCSP